MADYDVKGKVALVTGAGSGINLACAQHLLAAGCSVMIADLALRPEAEVTVAQYPKPGPGPESAGTEGQPWAAFHKTDVSDWAQLTRLWDATLETFGRVDIVVNGAGVYEAPSSSYWNPPGISPESKDPVDAGPGVFRLFAVNTMGPIRLSQIALDYWLENRGSVQGNLLWVASMGGYLHSMQTPLYFASKAAIVSMCKCLQGLRQQVGIRNSAICPGAVRTPLFDPEWCKDRLTDKDLALSSDDVAEAMMGLLTEGRYGDGTVLQVMAVGTRHEYDVSKTEVQLEALYPTVDVLGDGTNFFEEELRFMNKVGEKGMRSSC